MHLTEEQLVWYYYGEDASPEIESHLALCAECAREWKALEAGMAAIHAHAAVPDPAPGYEGRLWRSLVRRDAALDSRRPWWRFAFAPRNLAPRNSAWAAGLAALAAGAFFAGRISTGPAGMGPAVAERAAEPSAVRERLLVAALADHLEQSERILLEIDNLEPGDQRERAGSLLAANRLYRQTASREGKASLAATLDELERVLLDVAHSPRPPASDELRSLQARVSGLNLLFKIQSLGARLRQMDHEPLRHLAPKSTKG